MVEEYDRKLTFPNKNIKNISTSGMTEMEHVLKASGRPQTSQRVRKPPRNWAGQKGKGNRAEACTQGGVVEASFPHPGQSLANTEISLDGASEARSRAQCLWRAQQ